MKSRGDGVSLGDLIRSSSEVESYLNHIHSYSVDNVFSKSFGQIYYSDKVAYYNVKYRVLEIRMTFGQESSNDSSGESLHVVRMAFFDIDGVVFDSYADLMKALGYKDSRAHVVRKRSDLSQQIRLEASSQSLNEGIIIPCTADPGKDHNFADYYLPNGKYFYTKSGISLNNRCAVSCSCPSYRYTFAEYNYRDGVHLGHKVQPYRNSSRPAKEARVAKLNINKKHGLCKHLMLFALLLVGGEILNNYGGSITDLKKNIRELSSYGNTHKKQNKLLSKDTNINNVKAAINKAFEDYEEREQMNLTYRYKRLTYDNPGIDSIPTNGISEDIRREMNEARKGLVETNYSGDEYIKENPLYWQKKVSSNYETFRKKTKFTGEEAMRRYIEGTHSGYMPNNYRKGRYRKRNGG